MKKIILASQSPRRKDYMDLLGIDFEVKAADIDEKIDLSLSLDNALIKLAKEKATAVLLNNPEAIVIGSDSIVYQDDEIFNKPKNSEDAFRMIKSYSNSNHSVKTSVCIISSEKEVSFVSECQVYFYKISDAEINDYLLSKEYKDKAGAYAIQGLMAKFIYKVEGDYNAVVGFPIAKVYKSLKEDFNILK